MFTCRTAHIELTKQIAIRMEVASSWPDYLPTLSAALLVKHHILAIDEATIKQIATVVYCAMLLHIYIYTICSFLFIYFIYCCICTMLLVYMYSIYVLYALYVCNMYIVCVLHVYKMSNVCDKMCLIYVFNSRT